MCIFRCQNNLSETEQHPTAAISGPQKKRDGRIPFTAKSKMADAAQITVRSVTECPIALVSGTISDLLLIFMFFP